MALPIEFITRTRALLGEEYDKLEAALQADVPVSIRINRNKGTKAPSTPQVGWSETGYYLPERLSFTFDPLFHAGAYYVQEASSMFLEQAIRNFVSEPVKCLDLCAAPGGKSTHLLNLLPEGSLLVSNEVIRTRSNILAENITKWGNPNNIVTNNDPEDIGRLTHLFDVIVTDVPCSGEGMFRKDKKMVKAWEEHGPEFFSNLQKSIIIQAADMLKSGGMMLYSTCTFDERENEQMIEYLLAARPEFHIEEIHGYEGFCPGIPGLTTSKNPELKKTVRIFPHKMKGEGHFLALLQKGDTLPEEPSKPILKRSKKMPEELEKFLNDVRKEFEPTRLDIHGERVYYMPEGLPDMRGIRFLRTGLLLGELKKNRFEPSQAFAMSLKKEEYKKIIDLSSSDERVVRYLKGETLDVEDLTASKDKGWYLVCVDTFPLGWGKLANGILKNKYLPGWRLNS